jgi:hypothetical protein
MTIIGIWRRAFRLRPPPTVSKPFSRRPAGPNVSTAKSAKPPEKPQPHKRIVFLELP